VCFFFGALFFFFVLCLYSSFPFSNVTYSQALDEDGIAAPGQIIRNHDIYVNKQSPMVVNKRGAPLTDR
jgi:DNA-directed RNA polymerase beta subunit